MKILILTVSIIMAQMTLAAQNPPLECNMVKSKTELEVTVDSGSVVLVDGHEFISGHRWISLDGLKAKIIKLAELGSTNTVEFKIATRNQNERTKTYNFVYKRPWENQIISECNVTITKK